MQITESIVAQISRKTFNQMFDPALRRSKVLMSGNGSSVNWAENAGHANSADSLTDLSQIENMLADYVTNTALETTLASYATKTWVDQNYLSLSFFNALFQARTSQGAVVAPNSGDTTTIDNIKAMFGFWTDQYLSALGQGADGGGPVTTLAQLNDVQLSLPLADGEVLTYSTTLGKWTNGAGVSVAWNDITGKPTTIAGYGITDAHITNGVITLGSNSITPITSLSGYATESWVNTQLGSYVTTTALGTTLADYVTTSALATTLADYVSKTWIDNNYVSKTFFNRLFQAFAPLAEGESEAEQVEPNDVTTEIDNIKAMFGLWTEQYLSALGLGSDAGHSIGVLDDLNDVTISNPQTNQVLTYINGEWVNAAAPSGASALSGLTDVAISSLADKDLLQWDYASGKWKNVVLSTVMSGYATTSQLANYLPLSGGTISGGINPNADSTINLGSATARYHYIYTHRLLGLTTISAASDGTNDLILPNKSGTLAVTSDIPTNNNQLTNGAGYITGITSSMVTSALGYTPANSSSLSSYLPLSGGTLTGVLSFSSYGRAIVFPQDYIGSNYNDDLYLYAGTNKGLSFWTNGSRRVFITKLGYVGIGTASPSYFLTVNNSSADWGGCFISANSRVMLSSGSYYGFAAQSTSSSSDYWLAEFKYGVNDAFSEGTVAMRILCNGNVGINTGTPSYNLDVNGVAKANYVLFKNYNNNGEAGYVGRGSSSNNTIRLAAYSGNGLAFETNGSHVAMTIDTSQRVGIGTTTPSYKLHVSGITYSSDNIRTGGYLCVNQDDGVGKGLSLFGTGTTTSALTEYAIFFGLTNTFGTSVNIPANSWATYLTTNSYGWAFKDRTNGIVNSIDSNGTMYMKSYIRGLGFYTPDSGQGNPSLGDLWKTDHTVGINIRGGRYGLFAWVLGNGNTCLQQGRCDGDTSVYHICMQPLGGRVSIGNTAPSYTLHVSGDIYATGGVTALSDIRHKTIVEDTSLQVDDIARMRAIRYLWNDGREDNGMHVGSIAQDWQQILPEVVLRANDAEGTLSLQYGVAALISSITIARKVVNHEERINALERENADLKQAYSFIKNAYDYLKMDYENLKLKIA